MITKQTIEYAVGNMGKWEENGGGVGVLPAFILALDGSETYPYDLCREYG